MRKKSKIEIGKCSLKDFWVKNKKKTFERAMNEKSRRKVQKINKNQNQNPDPNMRQSVLD